MRAIKERWTPTSRLYDRGDEDHPPALYRHHGRAPTSVEWQELRRRAHILDCGITWQNYRDELGAFHPIDLTPQEASGGWDWEVPGLPFLPQFKLDGSRRIFPDRNDLTRWIHFPASRFLSGKTFTRQGNSLIWKSEAYDIILGWDNSRIKFEVIVKRQAALDQVRAVEFDVEKVGIDDAALLSMMTNLVATDSTPGGPIAVGEEQRGPIVRPLRVSLVQGVLTLEFDPTGMVAPVTIDPPLNLQVAADLDNGTWSNDEAVFGSDLMTYGQVAGPGWNLWARFLGVSGLSGVTITTSYVTYTGKLSGANVGGVVPSVIYAEDAESPARPVSAADAIGKPVTTGAAWSAQFSDDTEIETPSLNALIQDLADAHDPDVIQILHKGDPGGGVKVNYSVRHDVDPTKAAKLYIEYIVGGRGGGSVTQAMIAAGLL